MVSVVAFIIVLVGGCAGVVTVNRLGNTSDVAPTLVGPSLFLMGDGSPDPDVYRQHIIQVAGGNAVDIVILAATMTPTDPTPECDTLMANADTAQYINSCTTVTMTSASDKNSVEATSVVLEAETVYFAGGDQCNYVNWIGGTVLNNVIALVNRGGGVGGGSAGLAIQGNYVYNACEGSIESKEAMMFPYHRYITFTYDMFDWPNMDMTITDTHFEQRNRMGRLMTFVARQIQDQISSTVWGVGINEGVTLLVNPKGLATCYNGYAYIVLGDHTPEICEKESALTFKNYKIWKLKDGLTFDFANRPTSGYYTKSIVDGQLDSNPYNN
ncbi:peptidase S51 [Pelomyxa schiedti]|nr:peptidase S51 [Pelomyxa schiedti]